MMDKWDGTNIPGVKLQHEMSLERRGNEDEPSSNVAYNGGWMDAVVTCATIEKNYQNEGWPITSQSIYDTILTLKDVDTMGITMPVSFSKTQHRGSMGIRVDEVKGGKITPVTDWREAPSLSREGLPWGD